MNRRALLNEMFRCCFLLFALSLIIAVAAGCRQRPDSFQGVELVQSSSPPTPRMTFELRFEQPMAGPREIGAAMTNSPLLFSPALPGTFMWLSPRSGTFTLAEPLALDTRYELSLRPRLRQADGQPARAALHYLLQTPPFGLAARLPEQPNTNATCCPEIKMVFNAKTRASSSEPYLVFRDSDGLSVPAIVRQGTVEEFPPAFEIQQQVSWSDWNVASRFDSPEDTESLTNEVSNFLIATPRTPLTIGRGWKLVLESGLSAADPRLRLRQRQTVPIGNVTPFTFLGATAQNLINSGPSIRLQFSKPVPESLTNDWERWIEVSPRPAKVEVAVDDNRLTLRGEFRSDTDHEIKLRMGLPSAEPFTLDSAIQCAVYMQAVPSRLYFPAFSEDELAAGNRSFPLLAMNVPRVLLRAKLMDPNTAIHALRGYRSYFRPFREQEAGEPFRCVDYNAVPGRTVCKMEFPGSIQTDTAERIDLSWDKILGGRKNGVVFLDVRRATEDAGQDAPLGTQALIQLTDLGIIWKQAREGIEVFVFSHRTAQPIGGASVRLVSDENESLVEAATDTNGLAYLRGETNGQWLAVQLGEDSHAVELREHNLGLWSYRVPYADLSDSNAGGDSRRVMLFSDRNIYRPGETLHLKALARDWTDHGLTVPSGMKGKFEIEDARGSQILQTSLTFSPTGAWSVDVPLPAGPRGQYSAKLSVGGQEFLHPFEVQDFRPNAFEITLQSKPAFAATEKIELPLSARYYFGKPLSKAQVKWSIQAQDCGFQPEKFNSFSFGRNDFEFRFGRGPSSFAVSGQGVLSNSSPFVIRPEIPMNPAAPQPRMVSLLAEVTDLNQQTLSQRVEFIRHSSDFYLGLRQGADVLTSGQALPLEVVAVGADGNPWPATVKARMKLQRVEWESVRVQGAGRAVRYHNEAVFTNLFERDIEVPPVQLPAQASDPVKGQPLLAFDPLPAGQYLLEVSSLDAGGRAVISSLCFRVSAPADIGWDYRNDVQLALRADKNAYAPGQTAEVLVEAPFGGAALVTVEREKVLRSFLTRLEGNAPSIKVPIEAGDAPNVFVGVTLVRGSEDCPRKIKEPDFRSGYCQLAVVAPESRLAVAIDLGEDGGGGAPERQTESDGARQSADTATEPESTSHSIGNSHSTTNFLPGQTVEASVVVKDARGLPVAGAEVTLYAVDEGILSLRDYSLPDPWAFFYASRALAVQSGVSLLNLLPEDPEQLRFENKGFLGGGGGMEHLRKNFLACAFWNASLVGDSEGRVAANFPAPDSLTRYRVFAVAHADSRFGSGQTTFQVSKPLQVEPALPAFASLTDHLLARAVVQNQTAHAGEVLVTLELDDKARADEEAEPPPSHPKEHVPHLLRPTSRSPLGSPRSPVLTRALEIPAHGSAVAEFPLELREPGVAKWIWKARFADPENCAFTDSVQSTLEVNHLAPMLREVLLARVADAQSNLLARANPQLLAGTGVVTVAVANTRLSELGEAAFQLLHYPYGCAEQTGSSMLPWLVLRDNPHLLALIHHGPANTDRPIRAGIERFLSMQTESGGLGYWPGSKEPMLWASAYGGLILTLAQRQGFETPRNDFDRLMTYLSEQLRSGGDDSELSDCCLALYALSVAHRAEPAYHERLFGRRENLPAEDRAVLALAIAESHGPRAMIGELLTARPAAPHRDDFRFGSPAREQAIRLLAWTQYQPENPMIDSLVNDLMHDQKQGHWETTQADAWSLLALCDYARKVEGAVRPIEGRLEWEGQSFSFQLGASTNVFTHSFPMVGTSTGPLMVVNQSKNRLFVITTLEIRPPVAQQPRQDLGFSLQRSYERLDDDNVPRGLGGLRVGDRVLVTLRFGLREPARFMAIDDALPSIFEAINPEFKTQQARAPARPTNALADTSDFWAADFQEIRKDRFLSFVNWLEPGNYTLRYVARVRAAGGVTAPSAKIEEMYHPDRYGLSGTQPVSSQGWE